MTLELATGSQGAPRIDIQGGTDGYRPGVCNIGAEEIAYRRRFGLIAAAFTVVLFLALVALNVPPIARIVLFIPAGTAAASLIEAHFRFCLGLASLGRFNFGSRASTAGRVEDRAARAADRRRLIQLGIASGAIALAVAVIAVLLPV